MVRKYTTINVSPEMKDRIESYQNKAIRETLEETLDRIIKASRVKPVKEAI